MGPCSAQNPGVLKGASLRTSQGRLPGGAVPCVGFWRSSKSGREGKGAPGRENSLYEGLEVRLPALPARSLEPACSFFFPFSSSLPPPPLLGALCSVFAASHPLSFPTFPSFLFWCSLGYGWFSPPHSLCEAGEGCEGGPVPVPLPTRCQASVGGSLSAAGAL